MSLDFYAGLLIGVLLMAVSSIAWGIFACKLIDEYEADIAHHDQAWQQQCANIVLWNYVRRFKRGE